MVVRAKVHFTGIGGDGALGRLIPDAQLVGHSGEARVGRPQLQSSDNSGRQQMNVDPGHSAAVQVAMTNERDDIRMRDHSGLMHSLIGGQEVLAASPVADQEFSINHSCPATSSRLSSRASWDTESNR
jgi:hypothetical protein